MTSCPPSVDTVHLHKRPSGEAVSWKEEAYVNRSRNAPVLRLLCISARQRWTSHCIHRNIMVLQEKSPEAEPARCFFNYYTFYGGWNMGVWDFQITASCFYVRFRKHPTFFWNWSQKPAEHLHHVFVFNTSTEDTFLTFLPDSHKLITRSIKVHVWHRFCWSKTFQNTIISVGMQNWDNIS